MSLPPSSRSTLTILPFLSLSLSHKVRRATSLLLIHFSSLPQNINITSQPPSKRLRVEDTIRREPRRKGRLEIFLMYDFVRRRPVDDAKLVKRGIFLRR